MSNGTIDYNWWTEERVIHGLERFVRDLAGGEEESLPASAAAYDEMIPRSERNKHGRFRLYPPSTAVKRYFSSIAKAWWRLGYLVEVKVHDPKWKMTDEIKEMLVRIADCPYPPRHRLRPKDLPSCKEYARQLGIPEDVTTKWTRQLGLSRTKEPPWSDEEFALLDEFGYMGIGNLERKFKERGFSRSESSLMNMRKRRMAMKASPWYSANSLSKLFGVDAHVVTRWCLEGKLKFEMKGTDRIDHPTSGDTRLIHEDRIREFVIAHPLDFELRKVDQWWFLYIVTAGKVTFGLSEPSRLTLRMECRQIEKPIDHLTYEPSRRNRSRSQETSV